VSRTSFAFSGALVFAVFAVGGVVVGVGAVSIVLHLPWCVYYDIWWWLIALSRWPDMCHHCFAFAFGFLFESFFFFFAVEFLVIASAVVEEQFFADFDVSVGKHADPVCQIAKLDFGVDVTHSRVYSVVDEAYLVAHPL
jgi:hypothetical protein